MNVNYSDIVGSGSDSDSDVHPIVKMKKSVVQSLVELRKNYTFAITINHPRTIPFLNVDSNKQRQLYANIWNNIAYPLNIIEKDYRFEFCKSGQVHMHCIVLYNFNKSGNVCGLISDIVKSFLPYLDADCKRKKREGFKESSMYPQYCRYKSPALCVQYLEDTAAIEKWCVYMQKDELS